MNDTPTYVLLTTEGFASRAELAELAESKAIKVLRHSHPHVHLVRVNVKRHAPHSGAVFFAARATAENDGPDHVAHAECAEPTTVINLVMAKLERALANTAAARKHRLHQLPAALK